MSFPRTGASGEWKLFRHITFPLLRNTSVAVTLLLVIAAFQAFDEFYNLLSTGLAIVQARGSATVPQLEFFVSTVGRVVTEILAFSFSVSLFYVTYRYASARRLPWKTALLAAGFTAVLFEVAKRLYALYLANFTSFEAWGGDANLAAAALFILWVYYTAIVFLLGGVVAETWELRKMQERQRAIMC